MPDVTGKANGHMPGPLRSGLAALGVAALCPLSQPANAQRLEVDLELALMVDVSRSMTQRELEIQRRGYAEALRSPAVYQAVRAGLLQNMALAYVEWAGTQAVIVDWRLIETQADLDAFADTLTAVFDPALRRTSISGAIAYAHGYLDGNAFDGLRRVIDISGDGPNNYGAPVTAARDRALAAGITINGLPLMTNEGINTFWHLENLDIYYETCVTGGPGSFVIPVHDWDDFAEAVRRKLVLEIADLLSGPRIIPAQGWDRDPRDCFIGEKIWQERMDRLDDM